MAANERKNLLARLVTPGGDNPLTLRLVAPTVIRAGTPVSGLALVGEGGTGGYAYSLLTGSAYGTLPPGLTLNADGSITGTPTTQGHYLFFAQVQDSAATVYVASFSITVSSSLIRKHKAVRPGTVGFGYTFTFMVTGNTGAVTWAVVSGNLPPGLSLNSSTGVVSGTPTADSSGLGGISYFTLRATDGGSGDTLDMPERILIYAAFTYPGTLGITIKATIPFKFDPTPFYTGGASPVMYRASIPAGHEWLTYNRTTNSIEGTPGIGDVSPIPFNVPFSATDAVGNIAGGSISITVDPPPQSSIQMQEGGADVGPIGPVNFDFAGAGVSVSNDGVTTTITIPGGGGGGGGIDTINGQGPDSSGDLEFISPDASVGISVNSAGQIALTAASGGGGVGSVGGATPDSSGDVAIESIDDSILAAVDSNGDLSLTVNPATRAPTATFSNGNISLSGTLDAEIPEIPYGGTITGWRIVGDVSGDASIIVQHATFSAYDTMTTLFTATCTGAIKASATGLTHQFSPGDVIRFSGSGFANMTRCSIKLTVA